MTKRWVKKAEKPDWEEWLPPCGKGCFLNDTTWTAYLNRQWAITSMVHQTTISEDKPT